VPLPGTRFVDRDFRFGQAYRYVVRACARDSVPCLESDPSEAAEVTPADTFPPARPGGLVAVAGPEAISLSWEPVRDDDVLGYKIYRREAGRPGLEQITPGPVPGNAYTDATARPGLAYYYAVTACDRAGNESPKSEVGPVTLKEGGP
jgi:hypothetical protein